MRRGTLAGLGLALLCLAGPALADITFEGGAGESLATAVVIAGASGEDEGIAAEYAWLDRNRPGAKIAGQALVNGPGGKPFDILTIELGGRREDIFFDISGFFGK